MLELMAALTTSSPDLASTWDKVLAAFAEDVESHIHNDGFQCGVEMYFATLARRSTLASKLANVKGNAEALANLDVAEAERKTLMEELD